MGQKSKRDKNYLKKLRDSSEMYYCDKPALNWGENDRNDIFIMSNRYSFEWEISTGTEKRLIPLKVDLLKYILDFKKNNEIKGREISLYIGTDSQSYLDKTKFITALCLRIENNGVHVIISKIDMPKIYNYRYRLLRETDITAEFIRKYAKEFKKNNLELTIHADYNSQTNHKSNGVVTEASNYIKNLGFDLIIKPFSFSATYAADHFC